LTAYLDPAGGTSVHRLLCAAWFSSYFRPRNKRVTRQTVISSMKLSLVQLHWT